MRVGTKIYPALDGEGWAETTSDGTLKKRKIPGKDDGGGGDPE